MYLYTSIITIYFFQQNEHSLSRDLDYEHALTTSSYTLIPFGFYRYLLLYYLLRSPEGRTE